MATLHWGGAKVGALKFTEVGLMSQRIGESAIGSTLGALKLRGEYRNFAILKRLAEKPTRASLLGLSSLSVDAPPVVIPDSVDVDSDVTVWCSNDYLGMSRHPHVIRAAKDALDVCGAGAGGTRNISGTNIYHVALEKELAALHGKEAALIFTSGYNANEAALGVLGKCLPDCMVFSDALNHASMIAGIKASRAPCKIWRHNDLDHLRSLLEAAPADVPKLIAFESVYSMDGDIGPIKEVCDLADEFDAFVYLDEVHAVGLYGSNGAGMAMAEDQSNRVDIIQGTLGKAFGVQGGYIAGSRALIDLVRSFAPGFIFSTALSPVLAASALASVRHLRTSDMERVAQRETVRKVKKTLQARNIPFIDQPTHIVPVLIEGAATCTAAARSMLTDWNIYVQPIVYPTVPRGTERLRITPSPFHNDVAVEKLGQALSAVMDVSAKQPAMAHVG